MTNLHKKTAQQLSMHLVRPETAEDIPAIHSLNVEAFGGSAESDLVDALRETHALTCSLVAELDTNIVGHLAFSPVIIDNGLTSFHALGLAPMAVHPAHQKTGIGKTMIRYWLNNCAREQDNLVVVLGHPAYYPQFGFVPSTPHGIVWEHDVPEEVFMVLELKAGALQQINGTVRFHKLFSEI